MVVEEQSWREGMGMWQVESSYLKSNLLGLRCMHVRKCTECLHCHTEDTQNLTSYRRKRFCLELHNSPVAEPGANNRLSDFFFLSPLSPLIDAVLMGPHPQIGREWRWTELSRDSSLKGSLAWILLFRLLKKEHPSSVSIPCPPWPLLCLPISLASYQWQVQAITALPRPRDIKAKTRLANMFLNCNNPIIWTPVYTQLLQISSYISYIFGKQGKIKLKGTSSLTSVKESPFILG